MEADIWMKDRDGWAALYHSARYGHEAVTHLLLDRNADVEARSKISRRLLIIAAEYSHEAVF
jgi:ankyrin repeat protein